MSKSHIIIHCSATPEGREHTAADIRDWHVKGNGWSDIGYHYVVRLDGTVEAGRPESRDGAHAKGHNRNTIGVCYVGGCDRSMKPKDTRTPAQVKALRCLIIDLKKRYPAAITLGHRDLPNVAKACPSFDAYAEYAGIDGSEDE